MTARKMMLAGALSLSGLWSAAWGQFPGAPPAPAIPGALPVAAAAAPAQAGTFWSFLGISKPQIRECILRKCQTPLGQMMSKATAPLTMFTGGIIPPLCPLIPTAAELADQGVVGDAARIKAEEAQAKVRKAAVRYLGTVDCSRFPDAEGALIKALRTDTNECVRYEAALALGNGCCCTKLTMEKLSIAASCSDRDSNPREYSDRVRAAAVAALQTCLSCYVDPNPKVEKEIEGKPEEVNPPAPGQAEELKKLPDAKAVKAGEGNNKTTLAARPTGAAYDAKIKEVPMHLIVQEARRVVENYNQTASAQAILNREASLVSILNNAVDNRPMLVVENGAVIGRTDVASAQPNTLWDMLTRQTSPVEASMPVKTEVVVKNSVEPPTLVMPNEPMPTNVVKSEPAPMNVTKVEPMPVAVPKNETKPLPQLFVNRSEPAPMNVTKVEPMPVAVPKNETKTLPQLFVNRSEPAPMNVTKVEPMPVAVPKNETKTLPQILINRSDLGKNLPPRENMMTAKPGPYGEQMVIKPKTPAELASMPRNGMMDKGVPAELPAAVTKEPMKADRQVMKPIEPKELAKPLVTPLAQRALTVMTDTHPAVVRESIADTLTAGDLNSSPELVSALINEAKGNDSEGARKAAIRALVRGQMNKPNVMAALEKLQEESVPQVRVEAAIGLARLRLIETK